MAWTAAEECGEVAVGMVAAGMEGVATEAEATVGVPRAVVATEVEAAAAVPMVAVSMAAEVKEEEAMAAVVKEEEAMVAAGWAVAAVAGRGRCSSHHPCLQRGDSLRHGSRCTP